MKLIIAAAMLAAASAQVAPAAFDLNQYLLLDSLSGHGRGHGGYYYGGRGGLFGGHNGALPLLALSGGLGGAGLAGNQGLTDYFLIDSIRDQRYYGHGGLGSLGALALTGGLGGTGTGLSAGVTDYLVLDSLGGHGGMGDYLPAMMLSGQSPLGGTIGQSQVGQMWALDQLGGGHGNFEDILPIAALGGTTDINQLWGLQQMQHGGHNPLALMAATGQPIGGANGLGTVGLMALGGRLGHGGYGRRHGGYGYRGAHHGRRIGHHGARVGHHGARIGHPVTYASAAHAAPVVAAP